MKKIFLILAFLLSVNLYAVETIQSYKPIYFISGDKEDQVKYQVSFKYALWYPFESGLFLGYTQLAKWDIYDRSSPFRETNYNPNIFWEKENLFQKEDRNWKIDFIRLIPYEHKSNGRDGEASRSVDRYFGEAQISYGRTFNFGLRYKGGGYYAESNKNKDYHHYVGLSETEVFFQIISKYGFVSHERIYIKGEWLHNKPGTKYWMECGLSVRLITAKVQPNIYVQYYRGYAEFLENYNQFTEAWRGGFIFNI